MFQELFGLVSFEGGMPSPSPSGTPSLQIKSGRAKRGAQGLRPGAPGTPGTPGSAAPRLCLPQQVPLLAGCRGRRAGLSTQGPSQRLEVSRSRLGMPIGCPPPLSPRARRQGSALNAREMRSSPTFGGSACAREAHLWASAIDSICGNT